MNEQDEQDEQYDDDDEPKVVTLRRDEIRKLEKRAKQVEEAEARAAAAERRLAFAEAGINLSDPKLGYFVRGYDGEITAEAIRQAATEAGFLAAEQDTTPPEQPETEALERIGEVTTGGTPERPADLASQIANHTGSQEELVRLLAANQLLAQD